MEKIIVRYEGGESRYSNKGVDIMQATITTDDGEIELYAEAENPTWSEENDCLADEDYCYDILKAEIIAQAEKAGINTDTLKFQYD